MTRFVDAYENHAEKGEGLLPFGPPGSGKTHLAIAAARAVTQRYGARVKFVAGSQIFADVRAAIDGNGLTEADLLRELTRPDVLLIDDPLPPLVLGAGKTAGALTDFQAQWIYRVLEARWSACKATWGTMNVSSRDELSDRLGGASADRLLHGATVVRLNTATHRKPLNAI